jgi:lysophospholipase L1-like esterase
MMRRLALMLLLPACACAEAFQFRDNDRVAFVGNTVIERAQRFGHLESLLSVAAGKEVEGLVFRNLGWSGDSVFGDARSYFGAPSEGRERLQRVLAEFKPTVLIVCYGTNAAMTSDRGWTDDAAGTERSRAGHGEGRRLFLEQYRTLLDLIAKASGEGLREMVLLSPPPLETLKPPLPDQSANNARLAKYRDGIRELAKEREATFVDLFGAMGGDDSDGRKASSPLTTNGLHYAEAGYHVVGEELAKGLGLTLPGAFAVDSPAMQELRSLVIAKNRLFFHRWRPVNETYLFLFRKHEQGQNAKEIPMFDPLIAAEEEKIAAARSRVFVSLERN